MIFYFLQHIMNGMLSDEGFHRLITGRMSQAGGFLHFFQAEWHSLIDNYFLHYQLSICGY